MQLGMGKVKGECRRRQPRVYTALNLHSSKYKCKACLLHQGYKALT